MTFLIVSSEPISTLQIHVGVDRRGPTAGGSDERLHDVLPAPQAQDSHVSTLYILLLLSYFSPPNFHIIIPL